MKSTIEVITESATSQIEQGEYAAALTQLRQYRLREFKMVGSDEASRFLYLQARCLYHLGEYQWAGIKIRAALRVAQNSGDHSLYATEKQLLGVILAAQGQFEGAIEAYNESYVYRKRSGERNKLYGSLTNIGLCHFSKGNLLQAEESFVRALATSELYNSSKESELCRLNLARLQWLRGSYGLALNILKEVHEEQFLRFSSLIVSQVSTSNCDYVRAKNSLEKCLNIFTLSGELREQVICLEFFGLNEYFAGNYSKAREYYDQVLAMPEPTASAVAQTLRMLTDVEIAEGNWDAAKTTAAKAEVAINKISERIELGALWRAYGHIHAHDNDHARARENFEKSIDLLRQLGARYELALSHFDAGRSKAYSPDQQIEHLNQAKALFIDMEVPKRVAQVDAAISKISLPGVSDSQNGKRKLAIKSKAVQVPVIVAESAAMKKIITLADRIKDRDMNILITGETGTGKDLLAEYIHKSSLRAGKPFVVVNCAAIPEAMLESELFGYKKGSYTGAGSDKPGLIETASGGSFFLNEIGEAGISVQTKLLQVIEEKAVRRLGDNVSIKIDVRFIAATNQNLKEQIAGGQFRSDLFYRLNEMPICLPPLRERAEDAMALLQMLFAEYGIVLNGDFGRVENSLRSYSWPGNVRELIAIVNRVASNHEAGGADNLLDLLNSELDMESPDSEERHHLLQIVAKHGGNKSRAAQELGIPVTTLRSRLNKFNL